MRTGNFATLSARDLASVRERRKFEHEESERQRLDEDRAEYHKYTQTVENEQRRVPPAYRIEPVTFENWRHYADPQISDPSLRGVCATNAVLLSKTRTEEAEAVKAGKIDPAFEIPESAKGLRMSIKEAEEFARRQAELFVSHNAEYYPSAKNFAAISEYLAEQTTVVIPNEECFRLAWLRLRELSLIEDERPTREPEPVAVTQPSEGVEPELVDGFDPESGQPRKFSQAEIWRMDSRTYRKAFRMWGDNRPRFTRGYFG